MSHPGQSTGASMAAATSQRRPTVDLPPYQPPPAPLNAAAQRTLATLQRDHNLRKLNEHLDISANTLTEMAAAINDALKGKQEYQQRRKAKRAQQGTQDGEDEQGRDSDRELDELKNKVEGMTKRMEEHVRKTIDGQAYVEGLNAALEDMKASAASQVPGTQRQSQRRRARNDGTSDENIVDFDPTDPAARSTIATQIPPGPSTAFLSALETHKDRYQSLSLRDRYGQNNAYIGFKRTLHDAQHGDDGPPLGHYTTWFRSSGQEPAPGVTAGAGNDANGEDDDDDIAIAREKTSTKCPLTLQEFKDPVTSRKCPHSFEKEAILGMIDGSALKTGGNGRRGAGEKMVQCPVSGCQMTLTKDDLHTDPLLLRRIRRIQQIRKHHNLNTSPYGSDAEDSRPHAKHDAESIESDSGEDVDDVDDLVEESRKRRTKTPNVKAEKVGSSGLERVRVRDSVGPRSASRQIPVASGAVVMDLDWEDEEEEEQGGEEEEEEEV